MLYSIVQIIAFQALFLLVYDLFLRRETFFNYNRAYLLITSVLSFVLPYVKFQKLKTIATNDFVIQLPKVFIGTKVPTANEVLVAEKVGIIIEQPQTPLWQSIVLVGIALATLIFLFKIIKLHGLKHKNPKRWKGNILIVRLIESSAAFSFFNTIFLGDRIPETEKPIIYEHELVHIKELHTLDLLFFEILRVVFWFNPLIYIYQNRIKELHEYIADAKAVKQNRKADYYQSLLNQVFDVNNVSFTNTFFKKSLIKKRIAMLQKSKSKQRNLIKYAMLIPLVFGMLIYTSTEVKAQQNIEKSDKTFGQDLTDKELIEKFVKEFEAMEKNGATFFEIANSAGMKEMRIEKYMLSRNEFLKSKAYMQYIADGIIKRKSEDGTLTLKDIETTDLMRLGKFKTYEDFKVWKSTDEAKEHWESITRDGVLRLFVKEMGNQTAEEKIRLDGLLKQLESDNNFEKIIMTDGKGTFIIDSYESLNSDKKVEESIEVPFSVIDEAPTLTECKDLTTNVERKNCMSQFVNKLVNKNFNTSIAEKLGKSGRQRIFVSFKIDTLGRIKAIKARGPSIELEEEAIRVIKLLPKFIPGRQKGKLVTVPYSLPIVFQVTGDVNDMEVYKNDTLNKNLKMKYIEFLRNISKDTIQLNTVPFSVTDVAPVHADCKSLSTDDERRKCTAEAIISHVNKNFNTNLAADLGLEGKNKVYLFFHINKQGKVNAIKARAKYPKLEEEAKRVIRLLPRFTPGKLDGKLVDVPYSLPIVFQVAGNKKN